jgi:hypothetical protein
LHQSRSAASRRAFKRSGHLFQGLPNANAEIHQPLPSAFSSANAFSILSRCGTDQRGFMALRRFVGGGLEL